MVRLSVLFWLGLPVALSVLLFFGQPFSRPVAMKSLSLDPLTPSQRLNLQEAAQRLDGVVLAPRQQFSFNRQVGPRTRHRGFAASPSYVEAASPDSIGGGICILSSLLYQAALEHGMRIHQRVPHLRPMRTILPGLDATVWYGQADLVFENTTSVPIQLKTQVQQQTLSVGFVARQALPATPVTRRAHQLSPEQLQVTVFRRIDDRDVLVSRDLYRLTSHRHFLGHQRVNSDNNNERPQ